MSDSNVCCYCGRGSTVEPGWYPSGWMAVDVFDEYGDLGREWVFCSWRCVRASLAENKTGPPRTKPRVARAIA